MHAIRRIVPLVLAFAALASRAGAQPISAFWDASSGMTPDQACPPWTLVDTAAPEDPVLANGALTISTDSAMESMLYVQELNAPNTGGFELDARLRVASGSSSAANRGPVMIVVTTAPDTGTILVIGVDEIFLTQTGDVKGPNALVDTDGDFHTYHLEIAPSGAVNVLYDGAPTLTSFTYGNGNVFGPTRRIIWGEGADEAFGTSLWEFVHHNASVCPGGTTTTGASTSTTPTSTTLVVTTSTTLFGASSTTTTAHALTTLPVLLTTSTSAAASTTEPHGSTTTTTLPSETCDNETSALERLLCQLDLFRARIASESGLGKFQSNALKQIGKAIGRAQDADAACTSGNARKAKNGVKRAQRPLIGLSHRLRSLNARKQLDPTLRSELSGEADALRNALRAMKNDPCAG